MKIEFYKYQGTGNDFILMDNRSGVYSDITPKQVNLLCSRRFGIGADGLIFLNEKAGFDFEMIYFNSDGKKGSMCGNGARCVLKFASLLGIRKSNYRFIAADGVHEAEIDLNGDVAPCSALGSTGPVFPRCPWHRMPFPKEG
jgi:diaminopimelate epimerase